MGQRGRPTARNVLSDDERETLERWARLAGAAGVSCHHRGNASDTALTSWPSSVCAGRPSPCNCVVNLPLST